MKKKERKKREKREGKNEERNEHPRKIIVDNMNEEGPRLRINEFAPTRLIAFVPRHSGIQK